MKARDVIAAVLGRFGGRTSLIVIGTAAAIAALALPGAASAACSNEAIRNAQRAEILPDCRAWEMVSPLDKNNGDIVADGYTTFAAKGGDAVAYNARTGFAGTIGSGLAGQTQYVSRRDAAGWATHAVTPRPRPDAVQTFFGATKLWQYSTDLRTGLLWGYDLPDAPSCEPFSSNPHVCIYSEDVASRSLRTISVNHDPSSQIFFADLLTSAEIAGISDDALHVSFESRSHLLPQAAGPPSQLPSPSLPNVYQWDDGTVSLAGILPDGSVPPEGSHAPAEDDYRRGMSSDGSRQLFSAAPEAEGRQQLYQRIDGNRTVLVSESENEAFKEEPQNVVLQAATPDGRNVFFVTDSPLLEEDTAAGPDLYRWTAGPDPSSEQNLTLITNSGDVPGNQTGRSVVGVSDDGQRVYIHAITNELKVWNHGATRFIASVPRNSTPERQLTATASTPGYGRVSPDGRYLAFLAGEGIAEMYLYSLEDDTLRCVSCPSGVANTSTRITIAENLQTEPDAPEVTSGPVTISNIGIRPEFLAQDGRVFFATKEALLPQDVNGTLDAYQYDPATSRLSLLSSGRGSEPSTFLDASTSGNDVFIATRQRLVGADTDGLADVYDVRAGGGFAEPEPAPAPCSGDACQGRSAGPAGAPAIDTTATAHPNVRHRRRARCAKNQRHRKVRCVRKHHHGKRRSVDNGGDGK